MVRRHAEVGKKAPRGQAAGTRVERFSDSLKQERSRQRMGRGNSSDLSGELKGHCDWSVVRG